MMKFLILLALAVASNAAALVYYPALWGSSAYQAKDGVGNYAFGHHDGHPGGPSYHRESGDASGRKIGSYGVHGADGKVRVVDYVADQGGFRANIKTDEDIDKDAKAPAGVTYSKHQPIAYYGHPYGHYYGYVAY